ncbi:pyridine nucleotide-disulfide oxidoreductase [Mangrovimonas yunxiaonensis]|uniref:Pyridine nucleotide-disulfide oxidoreductase n=1 Tax=Mangrovimonas yunxiaonensis TaxID=1197477 RepID=A0A084TMN7_9FLAO|nr:FAD-dependent oxidoreductase [Mangrovimonas yunxiaonensis]KFB01973.1 pyridine nucleotide-disulfide oxidoreductase [Mangrovimonas yunxiaonensis]GGH45081.1 pyridine nucleotide-disulfide oxidoreductase [Mangrovimonas yunxiaonensis]
MYDALIIGGGASGMSCALVLGSAKTKAFAKDKRIGLIAHQRSSHLQSALFNNVLGLPPGTTGQSILSSGKTQLATLYPHVEQIEKEKVLSVLETDAGYFEVNTNKQSYHAKMVVVAVGYTHLINITGLEPYIAPHPRAKAEKNRIWLKNEDHLVKKNLYVAGTLAGWRSQFAIASGSGAQVATDILTLWNHGEHTKIHDKLEP